MIPEDIKTRIEDGLGTITIDRGDGRNALRPQTLAELRDALDALIIDPTCKAVVLAGAGKHFSAGAEFSFLQKLTTMAATDIQGQIYRDFQGAVKRLWNCPKPTIAAVNGAAVTVGCELALACDFRLASNTAFFQESWIKLGLMPPLGGLYLLPRLIGLGVASEMALTGRAVSAEEALRLGLVTRVVSQDDFAEAIVNFARELAALPPLAYSAIKEGLHRGLDSSIEKEWSTNVLAQSMLLGTVDFREGLTAVMERRSGSFTGS
jgi:enoyl-CoA hydratase/carnithine racemase